MSATAPRMGGSGIRWCSSALISMDPVSSTVFSRVQRMPPVSSATMPMTTKIRPTMCLADIYPPAGVAGARGSPVSAEKQKGQGSLASSASAGVTAACGDGHAEAAWHLPQNLASLKGTDGLYTLKVFHWFAPERNRSASGDDTQTAQQIVVNERTLRRHLKSFVAYYHQSRTHLGLQKDAPVARPVQGPETGRIVAFPEVGGLHHRYERRAA